MHNYRFLNAETGSILAACLAGSTPNINAVNKATARAAATAQGGK
ncbi:hypothetical protein BPUTEOMOX_503 [methanotrophic endosymbiont of Bathymodiolus puteoserpentis (Logatchev)]|nr:hypothetical protein BPUTEOMOX_503 [methanotrophic endosymbiont of Bathymodiolus puteoserpentis (Logatchev)]